MSEIAVGAVEYLDRLRRLADLIREAGLGGPAKVQCDAQGAIPEVNQGRPSCTRPTFAGANMPMSKFFHIRQLRCVKRASGATSARQRVFYTMLLRIPPGAESTPRGIVERLLRCFGTGRFAHMPRTPVGTAEGGGHALLTFQDSAKRGPARPRARPRPSADG